LGILRRRAQASEWRCKRLKSGHWFFTCPECLADAAAKRPENPTPPRK
jgi:hypothetical protein